MAGYCPPVLEITPAFAVRLGSMSAYKYRVTTLEQMGVSVRPYEIE
jgi:hypothetical protein